MRIEADRRSVLFRYRVKNLERHSFYAVLALGTLLTRAKSHLPAAIPRYCSQCLIFVSCEVFDAVGNSTPQGWQAFRIRSCR